MVAYVKITLPTLLRKRNLSLHNFLAELIDEYGDVFVLEASFLKKKIHVVLNPTYVKHILVDNYQNYGKPPFLIKSLDDAMGKNGFITTVNYDIWRRDRGILNPVFSEKNIDQHFNKSVQSIANNLDKWKEFQLNEKPLIMDEALLTITSDHLSSTMFSDYNLDIEHTTDLIRNLLANIASDATSQLKFIGGFLSLFFYNRRKKLNQDFYELGNKIITHCLSEKAEKDNLVKVLAEGYKKENPNINDENLRQLLRTTILSLIGPGYNTTATVLIAANVYLSLFPLHSKKIHEEVKNTLGNDLPTKENIAQLTYTTAVLKEVLRLQPPVDLFFRSALQEDSIGDHIINAGDMVIISPFHTHRLPKYWPNPEGFDPDRFLKELDEAHKFAYIPFSVGPRQCLGRIFAMKELTLILAMIVQRYQLSLTTSSVSVWHRSRETGIVPRYKNLAMRVQGREET